MGALEWLTLASIVAGIATTFAVPFAIWMTKTYGNQTAMVANIAEIGKRFDGVDRRFEETTKSFHIRMDHMEIAKENTHRDLWQAHREDAEKLGGLGERVTKTEIRVETLHGEA